MFNHEKLKVGDMFYYVNEHNQAFARKKIHQEIDGEDWFKYDRPLRTYEIEIYEVIGILRKELEGEWKETHELRTEFLVRCQDETRLTTFEMTFYDDSKYFADMGEALVHKLNLEAQAREMDMSR